MTSPTDTLSKVCTKCHEDKPLSEYHKQPQGKYGLCASCKVCNAVYKAYTKFGLSRDEYLAMKGRDCDACGRPDDGPRSHAIDHCHQTGKVRGYLCYNCNMALGRVQDSVEILRNLIKYLEK